MRARDSIVLSAALFAAACDPVSNCFPIDGPSLAEINAGLGSRFREDSAVVVAFREVSSKHHSTTDEVAVCSRKRPSEVRTLSAWYRIRGDTTWNLTTWDDGPPDTRSYFGVLNEKAIRSFLQEHEWDAFDQATGGFQVYECRGRPVLGC